MLVMAARFWSLLLLLTTLLLPVTASAFAPTSAETRVGGFEFAAATLVGLSDTASPAGLARGVRRDQEPRRAHPGRCFARAACNPYDAHRPLLPEEHLADICTWQEQRHVSTNLTLHYKRVMYLLEARHFYFALTPTSG